jgi:signal transduction histidine kinase
MQTFKSMVENAVSYTPRGETVAIETYADSEQHLVFSVLDSGPAMSQAQVDDILLQASRSKTGAAAKELDTKTGLTIGRVLIEAHRGQLAIQPMVGRGNLTKVILPGSRLIAEQARGPKPGANGANGARHEPATELRRI